MKKTKTISPKWKKRLSIFFCYALVVTFVGTLVFFLYLLYGSILTIAEFFDVDNPLYELIYAGSLFGSVSTVLFLLPHFLGKSFIDDIKGICNIVDNATTEEVTTDEA